MNAEKLLPCPFCGEVPTLDMIQADSSQGGKWGGVVCCIRGPEVRTGYDPVECWREEAIAAWNTRPAPTEAEVEAAAKRMAELCSPPKGASFEDACEWVPPTIEDLARAALGVSDG